MANIIQQLEDLKEWSQNPERYERRLAFRGSMGTEAGTIPAEFDELSPQEQQYYQNPPFSTHPDFLGAKGGSAQLVDHGPGRLGFKDAGLVDSMKIRFKLGDDIVENLNILMETDYPKSNKPEVIQKRIDDFAIEFKKITNRLPTANEIRGFGASSTTATSIKKAKYMKEGINYMEETDEMKKIKRIDVVGTEIEQKILTLSKDPKYIKEDGTPNIKKLAKDIYPNRKLDDARKQIRHTLERTIDYEGKKNIPGEITSAKQSKKNARENIKIAQEKAGIKTTKQADQVIDKILSQNEIYQNMSVEDIAKDKDFLKRLRVQIDPVTGDITFDGYTKKSPVRGKIFTDLELAQHAKNKAGTYELFAPDHINPKATRMQNVGYPINFQAATYMENSHLDNARTYLQKNPDGNWKPIDNYLSSKNLTIRGPEFKQKYGFKLPITFNPETGTSNIVELSFKKTVPKFKPPGSGGQAFHSFPANLPRMWKMMGSGARKALGWMTAAYTEKLFYDWDKKNEMSKGKTEEEAAGIALNNATFGIIPNKKYLPELKKIAEDMGINPQAFEKVYFLNEKTAKAQQQDAQYQQRIKIIKNMPGDPERKAKALAEMEEAYANWQKGMTSQMEKWSEDVAGQIAISKTKLPKPSLDQIAKERYNITDEDWMKPFAEIQMVGEEKLRREKDRAYDVQSKLANPESGSKYKWLTNLFTGTGDFWGRTKGQEKQRLIDDMVRFDPKELYRYNKARGLDPDSPVTKEALENLQYEHGAGLGLREERAGGGIANIRRPGAVPPESGPMPQGGGLSSQYNRVKKLTE